MVNILLIYGYYMVNILLMMMVIIWLTMVNNNLLGGFNLPLWKIMEWKSVGMMKFPNWMEQNKCSKPPTRYSFSKIWGMFCVYYYPIKYYQNDSKHINHRIGWWEKLQETTIFDGKIYGFL